MGRSIRFRRGAVVAVVALAVPVLSCAPVQAADPAPSQPTPGPSVPSAAEVAAAKAAAAAAAREVAEITAEVERAEARLVTLQRGMAEAVAAQERAEQTLSDAQAAVQRATEDLAAARRANQAAERALAGGAAQMYMQGDGLQDLTTLLLTPPNVMSDLVVVLDHRAHRVRTDLDVATSAAQDAASREWLLASARDRHAAALRDATGKRASAEGEAARAGAEAARLGERQEALSRRLAVLRKGATELVGLREEAARREAREAAARRERADLIGVQALGAAGSGPRAAQEIARSRMASYGWDGAEFSCLVTLWHGESGWSWSATNASSGAYGIPQSLPGWKMASAGSDWLTNPATQITWGMDYIETVYGSPCRALERWKARSPHWY